MRSEGKSFWQKAVCLVLAVVMVFSVVTVAAPQEASAANYNLKSSGKTVVSIKDEQSSPEINDYIWLKIKPKSDSYLELKFSHNSAAYLNSVGSVTLCNAKKKQLTTVYKYNTKLTNKYYYTVDYGLKKGTTYYVCINAENGVKITANVKKTTAPATKKNKAKTLTRKKTVNGLMVAGSTKSSYYKFKLTKSQKISVNVTPFTTDPFYITLSGPGVKTSTFLVSSPLDGNYIAWGYNNPFSTRGKVTKTGTYYIQIKPATKNCSGYYKINWK